MTREEIKAMKPGTELDAAVLEYACGLVPCDEWFIYPPDIDDELAIFRNCKHGEHQCYPTNEQRANAWGDPFYFHPSERISDAWWVVERLGNKLALQGPGSEDMGEGWASYKDNWYACFESQMYAAQGDTACEAICKAALAFHFKVYAKWGQG